MVLVGARSKYYICKYYSDAAYMQQYSACPRHACIQNYVHPAIHPDVRVSRCPDKRKTATRFETVKTGYVLLKDNQSEIGSYLT